MTAIRADATPDPRALFYADGLYYSPCLSSSLSDQSYAVFRWDDGKGLETTGADGERLGETLISRQILRTQLESLGYTEGASNFFLGDTAGTLKVTKLAKWKTTAQMVAIGVLFGTGIFEHMYLERVVGMDRAVVQAIFEGGDDPANLRLIDMAAQVTWWVGVGLLWIAAVLTLVTGLDYFRKAIPHLRDEP